MRSDRCRGPAAGAFAEKYVEFFDCNARIGLSASPPVDLPAGAGSSAQGTEGGDDGSPGEMLAAMDRAGVERALLWHVAQRDQAAITGNELLAEAIAPHERLLGCWSILPPQTNELGELEAWFAAAAKARVRAVRAFPAEHRYCLRADVLGELLEHLLRCRMPLFVPVHEDASWPAVYDLLAEMPELRVVLTDMQVWGSDRFFRPLLERYPNVYVDLGMYMTDGGVEELVATYGAARLLFGSGYPEHYHGGPMLALAHAEIADDAKQAIAAGNLNRVIEEVRL